MRPQADRHRDGPAVPAAVLVARHHLEDVPPRRHVRVEGSPTATGLHPGGVEAGQSIAELDPLRRREVERRVLELEVPATGRQLDGSRHRHRARVVRDLLEDDVGHRGVGRGGIDDHGAANGREPQGAVAHLPGGRLRAAVPLRAPQAVGRPVARRVHPRRSSREEGIEILAAHPEQPLVARHPQRACVVLEDREHGVVVEPLAGGQGADPVLEAAQAAAERPHPERAVGVPVQRQDHVVAQAVLGGVRADPAILHVAQAPRAPHPGPPVPVRRHHVDQRRDRVPGRLQRRQPAPLEHPDPRARRPDPHRAVGHPHHRPRPAGQQVPAVGEALHPPARDPVEAARRPHPDVTVLALQDREHGVVVEPVRMVEGGDAPVLQSSDTPGVQGEPDGPVPRLVDTLDIVGRQPLALPESRERRLAEAGQPGVEGGHPDVPVPVLDELADERAGQPLGLAVDFEAIPVAVPADDAAPLEPEPHAPMPVLPDRVDRVLGRVGRERETGEPAVHHARGAPARADPQGAVPVALDVVDRLVGQPLRRAEVIDHPVVELVETPHGGEEDGPVWRLPDADGVDPREIGQVGGHEPAALQAADASLGPHPEEAVPVQEQAPHLVRRQAVRGRQPCDGSTVEAEKARVGGGPDRAVHVLGERTDVLAPHHGRVGTIEDHEPDAVEPGEARLGADPDVAFARLEKRLHAVLRQPVLDLPVERVVLREADRRVEGRHLPGAKAQDEDGRDQQVSDRAPGRPEQH